MKLANYSINLSLNCLVWYFLACDSGPLPKRRRSRRKHAPLFLVSMHWKSWRSALRNYLQHLVADIFVANSLHGSLLVGPVIKEKLILNHDWVKCVLTAWQPLYLFIKSGWLMGSSNQRWLFQGNILFLQHLPKCEQRCFCEIRWVFFLLRYRIDCGVFVLTVCCGAHPSIAPFLKFMLAFVAVLSVRHLLDIQAKLHYLFQPIA